MPANLYKRNGTYYARIQAGGVDLRRSLQTSDKREAERRMKQFLATVSPRHGTIRRTWEEAAGAWALATEAQRKPKTWQRYALSLTVLGRTFEGRYIDQIDKAAVLAYVAKRKAEGVTVATIRRDLTSLGGVLELAVEREWLPANPVKALPKSSIKYKPPVFVRPSDTDVRAMIAALHGQLGALAELILETGMRRDEALYLRRDAVDFARMSARLDDTKNSSTRTISLTDKAARLLKALPVNIAAPHLFFCSRNGPYKRATEMFREANVRLAEKAQKKAQRIPAKVMIHDLRHIYAIRYLENGGNIYALQLQLGHGSIRQTEWYLRFLTPEAALQAKTLAGTKAGTTAAV